ncbi:DNA/RNA non-specific endonuclease [Pseudarthrobacter sulfonivorans]|uniref:DNA/RNA non-specific endonuclease n=1 Tax=Pseudarthrobacter sulfonivorans TaxID=121292 RepID=UPI00278381B3|nr:DNA/RNA non-specific endonuclease [Pseudarthrobacter sulfonivorans]MDP9999741.1 endonuclease G [Pseudarthrobacter sulfonivorans]
MEDLIGRLKAANARIERRDGLLGEEMLERREAAALIPELAGRGLEGAHPDPGPTLDVGGQTVDRTEFAQETIVLRTGRPVLAILGDEAQLVFSDPESTVWESRLRDASAFLENAARAVGRIEVEGHDLAWLGTGWLVRPDVVVTNRHVAAEFGRHDGTSFVFKQGSSGSRMNASIDFLEEIGGTRDRTFRLDRILHIEDADGPDVAFVSVRPTREHSLATPIGLSTHSEDNEMVAVIGYPARDSRIPDQQLMDEIFGNVYNKKRLAPGQLIGSDPTSVRHDCSTLGGNSGSVVLSLKTGEAVGLHFAGRFLRSNFAVPGTIVRERLDEVLNGRTRQGPVRPSVPDGPTPTNHHAPAAPRPETKFSFVVPLRVTVEVGNPYPDGTAGDQATNGSASTTDTDEDVFTEAVAADYRDRLGYDETFLSTPVPLPVVTSGQDDVLAFTVDGNPEKVLRYEHFAVMMSRSRRLCLFSAVNIDGLQSISMARTGWRTDPRIPLGAQIRHECYGAEPKFSRGHMTRREDPVWGPNGAASKANADSMHVTNAVPQMQPFNGGVWLELENYALQNARKDDMRISVFTGPFLTPGDPTRFGVQIPTEFWKVIAFIHDGTGQLCATGYTMSQQDFLREEEFDFGKHKTSQRSIASIEQRTGLSFGPLAALDPLEDTEGLVSELTDVRQIRFVGR